MRFPPISVIESWPPPNYINPPKRGSALLIVQLIFLPLALICVLLRLYIRIRMLRKAWWDDWIMAAASFSCVGVTLSVILADQLYGWNVHVWDLTYKQMVQGRKISIAGQTLFVFASGLAKLSILFSYLRIASYGGKFRYVVFAAIAVIIGCMFIFLVVLWTQCNPAYYYWELDATGRHCISEGPPLMGQTITTTLTDLMVYVLPLPTLFRLRLPLMQRIGLMVLFSIGSVVIIAGIMRNYWVHHVVYQTYDVTWEGFDLWIWTAVEVNLGVICGCIPSLKVLVWPSKSRKTTYLTPDSGRTIGSIPLGRPVNSRGAEKFLDTGTDLEFSVSHQEQEASDSFSAIIQNPADSKSQRSDEEAYHCTFLSEESLELPREQPRSSEERE